MEEQTKLAMTRAPGSGRVTPHAWTAGRVRGMGLLGLLGLLALLAGCVSAPGPARDIARYDLGESPSVALDQTCRMGRTPAASNTSHAMSNVSPQAGSTATPAAKPTAEAVSAATAKPWPWIGSQPAAGRGGAASGSTCAALSPLRLAVIGAPARLDSDAFVYRLAYADALRTHAYSLSRLSAPPAQLLAQRLRQALGAQRMVLGGSDAGSVPDLALLRIELTDFEQVFARPGQSHARVAFQATLWRAGQPIAQRVFMARSLASSPDAPGGARALAAASDAAIAQLTAWLASLAP